VGSHDCSHLLLDAVLAITTTLLTVPLAVLLADALLRRFPARHQDAPVFLPELNLATGLLAPLGNLVLGRLVGVRVRALVWVQDYLLLVLTCAVCGTLPCGYGHLLEPPF
jgi:hypothetical protein